MKSDKKNKVEDKMVSTTGIVVLLLVVILLSLFGTIAVFYNTKDVGTSRQLAPQYENSRQMTSQYGNSNLEPVLTKTEITLIVLPNEEPTP